MVLRQMVLDAVLTKGRPMCSTSTAWSKSTTGTVASVEPCSMYRSPSAPLLDDLVNESRRLTIYS
jgi:hypothetical protein